MLINLFLATITGREGYITKIEYYGKKLKDTYNKILLIVIIIIALIYGLTTDDMESVHGVL